MQVPTGSRVLQPFNQFLLTIRRGAGEMVMTFLKMPNPVLPAYRILWTNVDVARVLT